MRGQGRAGGGDVESGRARLGLDPHGKLGDPAPGGSILDILAVAATLAPAGERGKRNGMTNSAKGESNQPKQEGPYDRARSETGHY